MRTACGILKVIVAVAVALVLSSFAICSAAWGSSTFCSKPYAHDYERPFSRLPEVRRMPASGGLPFGPGRLEFYENIVGGNVIVGRGSFGYGFTDRSYTGNGLHLGWTVSAQMSLLDRAGHSSRIVDEGSVKIGTLKNSNQPSLDLEALRGLASIGSTFSSRTRVATCWAALANTSGSYPGNCR